MTMLMMIMRTMTTMTMMVPDEGDDWVMWVLTHSMLDDDDLRIMLIGGNGDQG